MIVSNATSFPKRKPYKMTLKTEQSGSRFVAKTDEDRPVIRLELFHDTVSGLKSPNGRV
jgi:hypothetical protein